MTVRDKYIYLWVLFNQNQITMNYILKSCFADTYYCIDGSMRSIEDAIRMDELKTFTTRQAAQRFANRHEFIALDVEILEEMDQEVLETLDGLENYMEL